MAEKPELQVFTSYTEYMHSQKKGREGGLEKKTNDPNMNEIFLAIQVRGAFYDGRLNEALKKLGLKKKWFRKAFVGDGVEILLHKPERKKVWLWVDPVNREIGGYYSPYYTDPAITIRTVNKERGKEIRSALSPYWNVIRF